MILKFLQNKKGGSTKSIDYVLDKKRVQEGTARILKGDEQKTRDIINAIMKKQKVTFGVLSFEEANIQEHEKKEIMQEFEKTFCAGLNKEQYNILWVEHTDKGRLELNFIIPKIELSTGRSFNPYYHKSDFQLAYLFQKKINLKYGFSDPQDPSKKASVQGNKKALGLFKGYRNLDKKLKELVSEGVLQSRFDILEILKESNIKITKIEKDKIEVKLEGSKKPRFLKGSIYKDEFTRDAGITGIIREQQKEERAFSSGNNRENYRRIRERLDRAVCRKAEYNREKYRNSKKSNTNFKKESKKIRDDKIRDDLARQIVEQNKNKNKRVAENEFRGYVERRARKRETTQQRARTSIYEQFTENRTSLHEQARISLQNRNRRRKRSRYIKTVTRRLAKATNNLARATNNLAKATNSFAKSVYSARSRRQEEHKELIRTAREIDRQIEQIIANREEPEEDYSINMMSP